MTTDFRRTPIASTSLFIALVTIAVSFFGNWVSGEGSPNASIDVLLLLIVAWAFYATVLVIAQLVQKRIAARDAYLPLKERLAPRAGRELAASLLIGMLAFVSLSRSYLRGDLNVLETATVSASAVLLSFVAVLCIRFHWRKTASGR